MSPYRPHPLRQAYTPSLFDARPVPLVDIPRSCFGYFRSAFLAQPFCLFVIPLGVIIPPRSVFFPCIFLFQVSGVVVVAAGGMGLYQLQYIFQRWFEMVIVVVVPSHWL